VVDINEKSTKHSCLRGSEHWSPLELKVTSQGHNWGNSVIICPRSFQKLFNLLHRARPEEFTFQTLRILGDIPMRCDPFQRIQTASVRFRVSFGAKHTKVNGKIFLDIMYIDGKPVLHIADEGTRFSSARFLPDISTKTI